MAVYYYPNGDYIAGLERDIKRVDNIIERMTNYGLDSKVIDQWRKINETQRRTLSILTSKEQN